MKAAIFEKPGLENLKINHDAKISEDIQKNLLVVERITIKYLGTIEHPLAKMIMENAKNGIEAVIELTPKFFSAWDLGKAM